MIVSKHIVQTSDSYIFCNEDVRTCVVLVTLMDSKGRKVRLKENIKKILNYLAVSNNFILSLSLSYIIEQLTFSLLVTCLCDAQIMARYRQGAFFICLLSFFLLSFVLSLILLGCDHVGDHGFRCVYVLALKSQYGCLIPFLL